MDIVNPLKFAIGIVFLAIGIFMLVRAKGARGFDQNRQAGALFLAGGALFIAMGFGFDVRSLF